MQHHRVVHHNSETNELIKHGDDHVNETIIQLEKIPLLDEDDKLSLANDLTVEKNINVTQILNLGVYTNATPADGDVWRADNTNTGLKIRINGVTKTITVS